MKSSLKFIVLCLAVCVPSASQAQKPSVEELIQKCLAAYDKAKTYQGTLRVMEKTAQGTNAVVIEFQAESGANGMIKRDAMTVKTNANKSTRMLDDGTLLYIVTPEKKAYSVSPHRPDRISGLFKSSLNKILQVKSQLKVSESKQGGNKVYAITGTPNQSRTALLINAANYQFESLHVTRSKGNQLGEISMTLTGQKFNAPIPASVFRWKVPAGYKKL